MCACGGRGARVRSGLMHPEARQYVERWAPGIQVANVLEIGGVEINGGVRDLFPGADLYESIDPSDGPGVDLVLRARDHDGRGEFDLVLCTEVLEHVEQPAEVIACAWRALHSGGWLILTCASTGRKPHGARGASDPEPSEWYRNVSPEELRDLLYAWEIVDLDYLPTPGDVRCIARKP